MIHKALGYTAYRHLYAFMPVCWYDKIKPMRRKTKKEAKVKRTTLVLPYDLWEELKIESIKKNKTMSQIIAQKLYTLKALESKIDITQDPLSF